MDGWIPTREMIDSGLGGGRQVTGSELLARAQAQALWAMSQRAYHLRKTAG